MVRKLQNKENFSFSFDYSFKLNQTNMTGAESLYVGYFMMISVS
jgi:hypothetical protein